MKDFIFRHSLLGPLFVFREEGAAKAGFNAALGTALLIFFSLMLMIPSLCLLLPLLFLFPQTQSDFNLIFTDALAVLCFLPTFGGYFLLAPLTMLAGLLVSTIGLFTDKTQSLFYRTGALAVNLIITGGYVFFTVLWISFSGVSPLALLGLE